MFIYGIWLYNEFKDVIGYRDYDPLHKRFIVLKSPNGKQLYMPTIATRALECFRRNPSCVSCQKTGEIWVLESHHKNAIPELHLYATTGPIFICPSQENPALWGRG